MIPNDTMFLPDYLLNIYGKNPRFNKGMTLCVYTRGASVRSYTNLRRYQDVPCYLLLLKLGHSSGARFTKVRTNDFCSTKSLSLY